jgi:hypothetical protein
VVDEPVKEFKHDDQPKRPLGEAYGVANNGAGVNLRVTSAGRSSSLLYNFGRGAASHDPVGSRGNCVIGEGGHDEDNMT